MSHSYRRVAARTLALALLAVPIEVLASEASLRSAVVSVASAPRPARPYTVNDMLGQESLGAVSIDPSERWLVFERRGSYESAERFDLGYFSGWSTTGLWRIDIASDEAPSRLLPASEDEGVVIGTWSPSGRRLLIHRLKGDVWEAGVVELETGSVSWLGVSAELSTRGRAAIWRSEDDLILIAKTTTGPPRDLTTLSSGMAGTEARWRTARIGRQAARTITGSGAFQSDQEQFAANRIVRMNLRSGERVSLAEGRFLDLELSPEGRHLAAVEASSPRAVNLEAPLRHSDAPEGRRLRLIDLNTGVANEPCPSCDIAPALLSWAPDGERLLFWVREADGASHAGGLAVLEADTGRIDKIEIDRLVPDVGATTNLSFSTVFADWLGDRPILYARAHDGSRFDWWRLEKTGPRNLTANGPAPPARIEAINADRLTFVSGGSVWTASENGQSSAPPPDTKATPLPRYGPWDAPRLRLNAPPRQAWVRFRNADGDAIRWNEGLAGSISPPGDILTASSSAVVSRTRENGVEHLWLTTETRPTRPLATLNAQLSDVAFASARPVPHRGPGGSNLVSQLYMPTAPASRPIPLVVLAYPGVTLPAQADPAEFNSPSNIQLLVAMGYAVLTPALPRQPWPAEPTAGLADQVLTAVDATLALHPELDPARLAYVGHSFGGYGGIAVAVQTQRFRSIVAMNGVSDLSATWGWFSAVTQADPSLGLSTRRSAGWAEQGQGAMGGPPWSDPDRYVRNSPLFAADRIETPMLLIHGDRDFVAAGQSEAMFTALWRQNKSARLITYWGEGHVLYSPGNIRDLYKQLEEWFSATLLAKPLEPSPAATTTAAPNLRAPPLQ